MSIEKILRVFIYDYDHLEVGYDANDEIDYLISIVEDKIKAELFSEEKILFLANTIKERLERNNDFCSINRPLLIDILKEELK